jgi:alpha-D-ribose 1-methylphosphonate 5-triphosphate synthase subunit PhnL|tara:strand:- start:18 stop:713 length:696 start_codon:yes stop_codon:yes gene_type:complete
MKIIELKNVNKKFILHNQKGTVLNVLKNINLEIKTGECIALVGKSGIGKSTFLKMLYGNYLPSSGEINIYNNNKINIVNSLEHQIINLRKYFIGYVSQFLRVLPRVPTIEIVSDTLKQQSLFDEHSLIKIKKLLSELNIQESMWNLSPLTFSGGEQQRVNLAKTLIGNYSILLLDEPTASLDDMNKSIVIDMIKSKLKKNVTIIVIVHDNKIRNEICTREINLEKYIPNDN